MVTAGARVKVEDAEIRRAFRRAIDAGADPRALLDDVGAYAVASTQRRFEAEAGPGGVKWAPFARSTLRRMSPRRRASPRLLRDTVRLYSSLVHQVLGDTLLVGTNLEYAAIHQFGGEVKQPARTQTATFRLAQQGAGRKFDEDGNVVRYGSRLRFAKASTRAKSRQEKTFDVGARTISIPARPYLGLDDADRAEILSIAEDHYAQAVGAEARP
jgi:phage virion morphogenesis protein